MDCVKPFLSRSSTHVQCNVQDKVQEANGKAAAKAAAPASPDKTKLATSLRAELEVHKEALLASKEEAAALANSLAKASSVIEVSALSWPAAREHVPGVYLALESNRISSD